MENIILLPRERAASFDNKWLRMGDIDKIIGIAKVFFYLISSELNTNLAGRILRQQNRKN